MALYLLPFFFIYSVILYFLVTTYCCVWQGTCNLFKNILIYMILRVLNSNCICVGRKVQKQPPEVLCRNNLKISQNLQENICARVSFLIKLTLLKRRFWNRCFPASFVKFSWTPFYRTPPDDCFYEWVKQVFKLDIREECDLAVETFCRHRRFTFKKYLMRSYYSILFLMWNFKNQWVSTK